MNSTNFSELHSRIQEWSADDEDILLRKLKVFTDNYSKKCEEIHENVENINKNINLIEIEYNNASNKLKNISIKRFMEHIVEDPWQLTEEVKPQKAKENLVILSKEERERNILNKFKHSITKSLENLNIKNLIDIKENNDNNSILDDDNISVSSSKYFQSLQKQKNLNIKLPYIIGTIDYFKNEYLGVASSQSIIGNMIGNTTLSNLGANASSGNLNFADNNLNNNLYYNNNPQQQNYFAKNNSNNNNNYANSNVNLDKLSMNMNLVEQIYEKKNSFNPATADDHLSELLFKNRKNELNSNRNNYNNNNNTNDFFDDANKIMNDQFRNIYSNNNNNNKSQNIIQDPNFVDFTKMNNLNYNNNEMSFNNNNNNLTGKKVPLSKDENEIGLGSPLSNEPLIPSSKGEKVSAYENKNNFKNTNNNLLIPNRTVSLDNFIKRADLFDGNVIDYEEDDDNTGIFGDKNKEARFNLLVRNNKNNIFTEQDSKVIEESFKDNQDQLKNKFDLVEDVKEEKVKTNAKEAEQRLGSILRDLDEENTKNNFAAEKENPSSIKTLNANENLEKQRTEEKFKAEKNKNKPTTNNLFSESLLEEEEDMLAIKIKKNENNNTNKNQKETKEPRAANAQADNKSSLLKAKNTLKMLFNEDEDELDNSQKNVLIAAEKIDKKSNNLSEKLNNLLFLEHDSNENEDDKLFVSKNKDEKKKEDSKLNKKSQKNLNLLVFDEEESEELGSITKLSSKINAGNKTNSKAEIKGEKSAIPTKSEFENVFEDIFANSSKPQKIEVKDKEMENHSENDVKESNLLIDNNKKEVKNNLINFGPEPDEMKEINKSENSNNPSKDLLEIFTNSASKESDELNQQKLKSKKNLELLLNLETEKDEPIKSKITKEEAKTSALTESLKPNLDHENKPEETPTQVENTGKEDTNGILNSNQNEEEFKSNYVSDNNNPNPNEETNNQTHLKSDIQNTQNEEKISAKEESNSNPFTENTNEKPNEEVYEGESKSKMNRRTTNTMINAETLPGLESKNNATTLKAKINFDDLDAEDNVDKSLKNPLNKQIEKQEKIKKQPINFDDPLKPLKKKSSKNSTNKKIEKPKAAQTIKAKNPIKNVFEDSEEEENIISIPKEKLVTKKEEVEQADERQSEITFTLNKPEKEDVLVNKEDTEIKEENKETQQTKPEVKTEDKRKSIKVNKFSEIQKLLSMKMPKPGLAEVNDNNFFIPMKPQNVFEDKIPNKKLQEGERKIEKDTHLDISVVKNKKKPMLKKFSLLSIPSSEAKNINKLFTSELDNKIEDSKEDASGKELKQENFKALLNQKLKENKTESPKEVESFGAIKELSPEIPLAKNQDESNIKSAEKVHSDETNNGDKKIAISEELKDLKEIKDGIANAEVTKLNEPLQKINKEENQPEITKEEFLDEKINDVNLGSLLASVSEVEKNSISVDNKALLNQDDQNKQEDQTLKMEENQGIKQDSHHQQEDKNLPVKIVENDQAQNLIENADSIKKVKKIEFNDDEEVNANEKIIERKSKDFLAKKKDSEKIKALKNKAKITMTTIKPRLSTNTGGNKTLNFDEEDD